VSAADRDRPAASGRRPPPPFRPVEVIRTDRLSGRLARVTLSGPALEGLVVEQPAASVRVLLPAPHETELTMPEWTGNAFLLPDGRRPVIRTLTPRHLDAEKLQLDVDVVLHDGGAASEWAQAAGPGDPAAVSGPARGYSVDPDAPGFFLAGDETAIPAISQLLERLPAGKPVRVEIEVADPRARMVWPERSDVAVNWLDLPQGAPPGAALVAAAGRADLDPETRVWVAGEAASVQRIRRLLFEERGLLRSRVTVRGYWKYGRAGSAED
jgi:NADPH-dependent ferric siderophore reductase